MSEALPFEARPVLETTVRELRNQYGAFEQYVEQQLDQLAALRRHLEQRQQQVDADRAEVQRQRDALGRQAGTPDNQAELLERIESLQTENDDIRQQLETARQRTTEGVADESVQELEIQLQSLTKQRDQLRRHLEAAQEETARLSDVSAGMVKLRGELLDARNELLQQREQFDCERAAAVRESRQRVFELEDQLEKATRRSAAHAEGEAMQADRVAKLERLCRQQAEQLAAARIPVGAQPTTADSASLPSAGGPTRATDSASAAPKHVDRVLDSVLDQFARLEQNS